MTIYQQQCLLGYLGYSVGIIDGIYGSATRNALKQFQTDYLLPPTGVCDSQTEKMLVGVVAGTVAKKNLADAPEKTDKNATDNNVGCNTAAQYLHADGYYHIPRGVNVQLTRNFNSAEIHCQGVGCCAESVISKRIMDIAQAIRDEIGEPLAIGTAGGSGYRCSKHNADVKGAANSLHVLGDAVDLHYRDPAKLKAVALHHVTDGEIGLYSWGCHVGVWNRGYLSQFNGG